jgi:hypothetical protein
MPPDALKPWPMTPVEAGPFSPTVQVAEEAAAWYSPAAAAPAATASSRAPVAAPAAVPPRRRAGCRARRSGGRHRKNRHGQAEREREPRPIPARLREDPSCFPPPADLQRGPDPPCEDATGAEPNQGPRGCRPMSRTAPLAFHCRPRRRTAARCTPARQGSAGRSRARRWPEAAVLDRPRWSCSGAPPHPARKCSRSRGISSTRLQGLCRASSWKTRISSQASLQAPVLPGRAKR